MLASSQTIAPKPAALPSVQASQPAHPALPGSGSAGGPSFAQFLNDQPGLPTPPAHADPVPREPESPTHEPAPAAATATATTRRPAAPAPAKPAQGRTPDAAASAKPEQGAVSGEAGDDSTVATTDGDGAQDLETSGLAEFTQLIGLTPPALPAQAASSAAQAALPGAEATADDTPGGKHVARGRINRLADDDSTSTARAGTGADAASAGAFERRPADATSQDVAPRAKSVEQAIAADKVAARAAIHSDALQAASSGDASTAHAATSPDALPTSFAAVLAQAMPALAAAADTAPVSASGQVQAAVHSNAFAPELGARVSLLAVDGVQQAELQLNPADMGPVAVQIVIDGSQAQVSFHAAQAETRQALEQSLPDLAAALQSQGLTLSGGGVFQQTQQDQKDPRGSDADAGNSGDDRSSRTTTGGGRIAAGTAAAPARRAVGLLDTFA
ncbi:flagellar hook-length control protein FliK [Pelomonas sp. Root1237]|uniref:flagellar hook-length control protein FliK n=1 Tax=Pelomonas sp. Root1237 TaxID=1736434 RepID=UPI000ABE38AA|nr:flagellar hook-length control protein FliK [Pelomonas sp. Root1237]